LAVIKWVLILAESDARPNSDYDRGDDPMLHAMPGGGWRVTSVTFAKATSAEPAARKAGGFFVFERGSLARFETAAFT
jgi:hypothetical protein